MSHTCEVSLSLVELKQVIPLFFYCFIAPRDRTWLPGASVEGRREGRVCSGCFQPEVIHYVVGRGEGRVCSGCFQPEVIHDVGDAEVLHYGRGEGRGGSVLDGMSSSSSFMASAKVEPLGSQSSSEVEGRGSVSLIHVHL